MKTKNAAEAPGRHEPDWAAIDALTDEQIAEQIARNPDAAPDISDWPIEHATIMEPIDVTAIRTRLGMSPEEFAQVFDFDLLALRDWERQRRAPRGPAYTLLRIIEREPEAARRALAPRRAMRTI